ncbi:MAG: hypothetical protein IPL95_12075 [Saprospiraceae bacterium]|nr:hypothetical protein [Saprospiraceae bacterium]
MKTFLSIYKPLMLLFLLSNSILKVQAQDTTKLNNYVRADTINQRMNMDAIFNRPFLAIGKSPIAIGGYIETNVEYAKTDGVSDGFNFQMRRLTLFFSSTITKKIKFLSELEFEDGTREINIESALMDMEFHPMFNLRGGIVLNPIGAYNQNHDGPRWDFIDRPISMTEIVPSTLSNVGFGFHGKYFLHNWSIGYETYLTNGFDDKLILNESNRTSFHEAKENANKFEKSSSGLPMFTGKIALRNRNIGEIGISYLTGVYNTWKKDGLIIENKRSASLFAVDFNTSIFNNKISINGEVVKAFVELPENYVQTYGSRQFGGYCDIIATVLQRKILGWNNAKINVGIRFDYADFNQNKFKLSNEKIFDDTWVFTPSIAFRPYGTTVIRLNYKYQLIRDIVGNEPSKLGAIQFGLSTYF